MNKRNYIKSNFSESWYSHEHSIVYQVISPKIKKINLEIAKQLVNDRKHAAGNISIKVSVLVVVNNAVSVDPEAKKFYNEPEAFANINSIAMLMDNYVAKLVGTVIFLIKKPLVTTAIFNSEAKAIEWLKKQQQFKLN